jgi:hypothetical protein
MALKMAIRMFPCTVMMKKPKQTQMSPTRSTFSIHPERPTFPTHPKKRYSTTFDSAILQTFDIDGADEQSKEEIQTFC